MNEIWKTIPGFSTYQVSNTGKIRSLNYKKSKKIKELKPAIDGGYYKTMILSDNKIYATIRIHRLIALTFLGESHLEVNHIDGNKLNNNVDNLEYCSHSYNVKHACKLGLEKAMKGSDNPKAKLTNEQVLEIRAYALEHGYLKNRKELSKKYNVGEGTLKDIVKKRRGVWSHI